MLDAVLEQAQTATASRVIAVRARIGTLSGVVEEALTFAWQALTEDTAAAGSTLSIENVKAACYCPACAVEFDVRAWSYRCPTCGALSKELRRGREMQLVSIEVE